MQKQTCFAVACLVGCGGATTAATTAPSEGAASAQERAAQESVAAIPEGYHTITPVLVVTDIDAAVEFYQAAFGATTQFALPGADGNTMHAEVQIGDSRLMLEPESEEHRHKAPSTLGATTGGLFVYVEDVDQAIATAEAAGATVDMPPEDMFWGDRYGEVSDPNGHSWAFATHKEDLGPEEITRRGQAFIEAMVEEEAPPTFEAGPPAENWRPEGYFTVTPVLVLPDPDALAFYETALGATTSYRMLMPDGRLMHGEARIGDSPVMFTGEFAEMDPQSKAPANVEGVPFGLMVYSENVDALFQSAVAAGATESMPVSNMFWGDRFGQVHDPSGHEWGIATHIQDLSPDQIQERMREQFSAASDS